MLVYGTVMPWKGDRGNFNWSEHHRVIPEQCAEWLELKQTHSDAELCVAGDFNTDMGTGRRYGTKKGIAAVRSGLKDCELFCATEHARIPAGLISFPLIDHIALSLAHEKSTSIVAAWDANKKTLSDHSGVVIEIAD